MGSPEDVLALLAHLLFVTALIALVLAARRVVPIVIRIFTEIIVMLHVLCLLVISDGC